MTSEIEWICQGVELPALDSPRMERWLAQVAESHGRLLRTATYIFCSDSVILDVNQRFLHHDYYTDIITFDNCTGQLLRGDIYISLDTVRSNAEALGTPCERELLRVIVHGILHLCGINDKGPGERQVMEANEDAALALLDSID